MEQHERFQKARLSVGFTQLYVGKILNLSKGSVSKYENGGLKEANMDYVRLLKENGVSPNWLLFGEGEMMEADNTKNVPSDYEEIKKENQYLRKEIEELKAQLKQFLGTINLLSGKPSEHKKAAVPNEKEKNSFSLGLSYVPAFT